MRDGGMIFSVDSSLGSLAESLARLSDEYGKDVPVFLASGSGGSGSLAKGIKMIWHPSPHTEPKRLVGVEICVGELGDPVHIQIPE